MKQFMPKLLIFGITLFMALPAGWSQEFNYASYIQTTLQDIIMAEEQIHSRDQAGVEKCTDGIQLECLVSKYQVSCCYSNISRPISETKKNVIKLWMEALNIDPQLVSLYQQEILVKEGMRPQWIPVQEQLLPHINQELVKYDTIELFIILTGKVESEYIFIATEFEKSISPAQNLLQATASTRAAP
ncbi:hypothetical protein JW935_14110 [candidate division KSB1 bacterium]|nr:hypothetical protein [candidate division KSB1 bacterium]